MKIDLAAQARMVRPRRKLIELREIVPTKAQETDLARLYMAVVRVWANGARNRILPAYRASLAQSLLTTDRAGEVEAEIEAVEGEAVRVTFTFRGLFQSWADAFQRWHTARVVAGLRYSTGVDLETQLHSTDVAETIEEVLARNVALVRDINNQARGRISEIVFRGLQNRTPAKDVAREISKALGLSRDRALRIASDQTQKLSSTLDAERGMQLGFTGYDWVHSGKRHPRRQHLARNGKYFAFGSDVDRTDPPGYAPFCGCKRRLKMELA